MKTFFSIVLGSTILLAVCSCGNKNGGKTLAEGASGDITAYEESDVNAIQQALPTIMVMPSDNLLKACGALTTKTINGKDVNIRDYNKFFISNKDNKVLLSEIQDAFVKANYPIQSLEQTLKQLENKDAYDAADQLDKDAKTILLSVAQPDMIIELDYDKSFNNNKDITKSMTFRYTLNVIDPYTNNVISSSSEETEGGETKEVIKKSLKETTNKMLGDIQNAFSDILTRGRNITVRIAIENGSNVSLSDTNIDGDTYTDWCVDYVKTHTIKGAYKMQTNTNKELYFVNCRIALLNQDGTQYGVYDWARDFSKSIRKNLGVKVTNKSQGLGEVLITISGM